eukprot:scaffold122399_cov16-Prasinocladus_malaysianus.AAC.1
MQPKPLSVFVHSHGPLVSPRCPTWRPLTQGFCAIPVPDLLPRAGYRAYRRANTCENCICPAIHGPELTIRPRLAWH